MLGLIKQNKYIVTIIEYYYWYYYYLLRVNTITIITIYYQMSSVVINRFRRLRILPDLRVDGVGTSYITSADWDSSGVGVGDESLASVPSKASSTASSAQSTSSASSVSFTSPASSIACMCLFTSVIIDQSIVELHYNITIDFSSIILDHNHRNSIEKRVSPVSVVMSITVTVKGIGYR